MNKLAPGVYPFVGSPEPASYTFWDIVANANAAGLVLERNESRSRMRFGTSSVRQNPHSSWKRRHGCIISVHCRPSDHIDLVAFVRQQVYCVDQARSNAQIALPKKNRHISLC